MRPTFWIPYYGETKSRPFFPATNCPNCNGYETIIFKAIHQNGDYFEATYQCVKCQHEIFEKKITVD